MAAGAVDLLLKIVEGEAPTDGKATADMQACMFIPQVPGIGVDHDWQSIAANLMEKKWNDCSLACWLS